MRDLRSRLTEGDPLLREEPLTGAESERLRLRVLAKQSTTTAYSRLMLPITAMLLFVAVGSAWLVRTSVPGAVVEPTQLRPRQLQFSTSGGTRIIWTFNDNFELR